MQDNQLKALAIPPHNPRKALRPPFLRGLHFKPLLLH